MDTTKITPQGLIDSLEALGHIVFKNDTKNYNLNLIGIRADNDEAGKFDDLFVIIWKHQGRWNIHTHTGTTDPGKYWLRHPLNKMGTAMLKPGQYRGAWKLGLHQGKYKALVQRKAVTVIRDNDKDYQLDFDAPAEHTGMFGINHHRANAKMESIQVGKWSAGCQVRNDPDEYDEFIDLCEKSAEIYGNSFSYTLIEEKDLI